MARENQNRRILQASSPGAAPKHMANTPIKANFLRAATCIAFILSIPILPGASTQGVGQASWIVAMRSRSLSSWTIFRPRALG